MSIILLCTKKYNKKILFRHFSCSLFRQIWDIYRYWFHLTDNSAHFLHCQFSPFAIRDTSDWSLIFVSFITSMDLCNVTSFLLFPFFHPFLFEPLQFSALHPQRLPTNWNPLYGRSVVYLEDSTHTSHNHPQPPHITSARKLFIDFNSRCRKAHYVRVCRRLTVTTLMGQHCLSRKSSTRCRTLSPVSNDNNQFKFIVSSKWLGPYPPAARHMI